MTFDRKSMESIVADMIAWSQGVTTKITDFRVGSRVRTIMESVAIILEAQTDKLYRSIRELIETNVYAIFGFDRIPATYATGIATFSRMALADQAYLIPSGTAMLSQASQYSAPMRFYTTADAIIAMGTTSVDVSVICDTAGNVGNIPSGTLTTFLAKPTGVDSVTNNLNYVTGAEEETSEAQKSRFQAFLQAQSRGVLQSIEYGATTTSVVDTNTGLITEKVVRALALEDLVNKLGQIQLYIWNGAGTASAQLITNINQVLAGYYDAAGNPVYGFKPAGILVNVYSATINYVTIKLAITPETWTTVADLQDAILSEVNRYFASLTFGQSVIQSALEANIKYISGVHDVKLSLSTDGGATYSTDNVAIGTTGIAVLQAPIIYI